LPIGYDWGIILELCKDYSLFFLLLSLMTDSFPSHVERYDGVIAIKHYNMDLIIKLKGTQKSQ